MFRRVKVISRPKVSLPKLDGMDWALWSLVGVSVFFRLFEIHHYPGVSGDEAWSAVYAKSMLQGGKFEWITPSHRLLNPFYASIVIFIQACVSPSFFWLRFPAVLSGLALIPLSYFMLKQVMDKKTAFFSTVLIACLPIHIAYSRIAWELCQAGVTSLIFIYFIFKKSFWGSVFGLALCLLVHISSIFLIFILIVPWLKKWLSTSSLEGWSLRVKIVSILACLECFYLSGHMILESMQIPMNFDDLIASSLGRILLFPEFPRFLSKFVGLILGWSTFEDFASPIPEDWFCYKVVFSIFGILLLSIGSWTLFVEKKKWDLLFVAGWAAMLLAIYAVIDDMALNAGVERYVVFLGVPTAVLIALLLVESGKKFSSDRLVKGIVFTVSLFFLVTFWQGYFVPMQNGGFAHLTYKTAPLESKKSAYGVMLRLQDSQVNGEGARPVVIPILAESWWLYWPLRYLASDNPRFHVYYIDEHVSRGVPQEDILSISFGMRTLLQQGAFVVGKKGGWLESVLVKSYPDMEFKTIDVEDERKPPFFTIWTRVHK